ncbi:MAG: hypothetical protein K940chlam8_01128 [Chlamydiae bacterium]|nr:hypothetical protein [Chlamydiota bacterium]
MVGIPSVLTTNVPKLLHFLGSNVQRHPVAVSLLPIALIVLKLAGSKEWVRVGDSFTKSDGNAEEFNHIAIRFPKFGTDMLNKATASKIAFGVAIATLAATAATWGFYKPAK